MAQRGSSSRLPRPIGLAPVDRLEGDEFSGTGPVRCGLVDSMLVAVLVALLGGCVTTTKWKPGPVRVTTRVFDETGREVSGEAVSNLQILGLGPRVYDPLQDLQDTQGQSPEEIQRRKAAAIRNRFGSEVLIRGDLVTKRYFMSGDTGDIFLKLIRKAPVGAEKPPPAGVTPAKSVTAAKLGGEDDTSILGAMLRDNQVEISFIDDFEHVPQFVYSAPPGKPGTAVMVPLMLKTTSKTAVKNDLLLVTAKAPDLQAFENALNLFYANIPQVEIEVKVVEFSTSKSLSFGTGGTDSIPAAVFNNLSGSNLISKITSSFPLSSPVGSGTSSVGLFDLGGIHDGWQLDATLQVLMAQGKADVLSSPKLMVRNGGEAAIATFTEFPFPEAKISGINTAVNVKFRPVGIMMGIRPIIAGTETIILQIHVAVSAVTGFIDTLPVPTPIVSTRTAITSVHVPNGKTTIIAGLRAQSFFDNETKIPILGDIPILGYLFRQTTTQSSETELQFFITPRIKIGPVALSSVRSR